jgi:hypothetical protein
MHRADVIRRISVSMLYDQAALSCFHFDQFLTTFALENIVSVFKESPVTGFLASRHTVATESARRHQPWLRVNEYALHIRL